MGQRSGYDTCKEFRTLDTVCNAKCLREIADWLQVAVQFLRWGVGDHMQTTVHILHTGFEKEASTIQWLMPRCGQQAQRSTERKNLKQQFHCLLVCLFACLFFPTTLEVVRYFYSIVFVREARINATKTCGPVFLWLSSTLNHITQ